MTDRAGTGEREGRLLMTMVNVLTAGLSDPSRLGRGRTYARQGAVLDLHVEAGVLTASVQGSRSRPYDVTVHVAAAPSFDTTAALVPVRRDIRFSCTCPDWDDPCKHAVAVMVTFAEHVGEDPALLALWRGKPQADERAARAVVGSRAATSTDTINGITNGITKGPTTSAQQEALDPETKAALAEFLGTPTDHETPAVSALRPPVAAWGELWAEMLADALGRLTADARTSR